MARPPMQSARTATAHRSRREHHGDRTEFVAHCASRADAEICHSIIARAGALGLAVVAEGVETGEHAQLVTDLGCTLAQGYRHGHPGPAATVDALLLDRALQALHAAV